MRICIIISDDVFFRPRVLYRILQEHGHKVCLVAEVRDHKTISHTAKHLKPFHFFGIKGFFMLGLINRCLRLLGRLPLPSFIRSRLSNRQAARFFNVPYLHIDNVNAADFIRYLKTLHPDVLVSLQRQIFGKKLLAVPKVASINCHPASLPKYRGFWPILSAMLNGDETIGVSVHTMTDSIDQGTILVQKKFATHPAYTLMDNYSLAHELYASAVCEAIDLLETIDITDSPGVPDDASCCSAPDDQDMKRFRKMRLKTV